MVKMDKVCKICLGKGSQQEELENILKDLLNALIISVDTTGPQKSMICKECEAQIHELFDFKTLCLYNEDALFPLFEENYSGMAQLDLRSLYSEKELRQFSASKEEADICRLCLEITTQWVPLETAISQTSVRDVFKNNLPEISLQAIERPCICGKCLKILKNFYNFALQCKSSDNIMNMNGSVENLSIETLTEANDDYNEIKFDIQLVKQDENQVQNLSANEFEIQIKKECKIEINENPIDFIEHGVERSIESNWNSERYKEEESDDLLETNSTGPQDVLDRHSPIKIQIPCCNCSNFYYSHIDLVLHSIKHSENGTYSCHICKNYANADKNLMEMHIRAHEGKEIEVQGDSGVNVNSSVINDHCEKTIISKKTKKSIPECVTHTDKNSHICTHCGKGFSHKGDLKCHLLIHTRGKHNICSHCGKGFFRKGSLNVHLRTHTGEKPHICSYCGKGFSQKIQLKVHLRTHTGEKPHICSYCGNRFSDKSQLTIHLRSHTGEKPYICSHCGKGFSKNDNLKVHLRTHTGEKPHLCSLCGKGFSGKGRLKVHLYTHTGNKPHLCSLCGKGFSEKGHLKVHLLTHTGEKPHLCSLCGKGFSGKGRLKLHLYTHTGEKPHLCSLCGKGFSEKRHLKVHLLTHTGEKPHLCSFCGKGFSKKGYLEVHLRTHTEEKPHICSYCGHGFPHKGDLKRHLLIHTGEKPHPVNRNSSHSCSKSHP